MRALPPPPPIIRIVRILGVYQIPYYAYETQMDMKNLWQGIAAYLIDSCSKKKIYI